MKWICCYVVIIEMLKSGLDNSTIQTIGLPLFLKTYSLVPVYAFSISQIPCVIDTFQKKKKLFSYLAFNKDHCCNKHLSMYHET